MTTVLHLVEVSEGTFVNPAHISYVRRRYERQTTIGFRGEDYIIVHELFEDVIRKLVEAGGGE